MQVTRPALLLLLSALAAFAQDHTTWRDYGGASDSAQYSALKQIDRSNVAKLEMAWSYPTGDGQKYSFNPVMVDGMLYVLAKSNSIVALDAATGKEIWTYTPDPPARAITNRGINYWESKDHTEAAPAIRGQPRAAGHRCAHRQADPVVRRRRARGSEGGPGPRPEDA